MWHVLCPQTRDLLNMKRSQLLCFEMVLSVTLGPWYFFKKTHREFRRHSSSIRSSIRLAVACSRGLSACTYVRIFIFYSKKKEKKKRTITSGSVCESCMPLLLSVLVSLKPTWQDHPFLKRQAALQPLTRYRQPHPKRLYNFTASPHPRSHSDLWGRREGRREGRHSASSPRQ